MNVASVFCTKQDAEVGDFGDSMRCRLLLIFSFFTILLVRCGLFRPAEDTSYLGSQTTAGSIILPPRQQSMPYLYTKRWVQPSLRSLTIIVLTPSILFGY